jgi:L-fuculose-phosphate aldolase
MLDLGLVIASAGNVSCCRGASILITPTSLRYDSMTPFDLCVLDRQGRRVAGRHQASSEYRLHLAIYREKPEALAIVHTHSPYAVALSGSLRTLPLRCVEARLLGAEVPVVPFHSPGSEALAEAASESLRGPLPCAAILEHHGVVAAGRSLAEALEGCQLVEFAARVHAISRIENEPLADRDATA